VLPHKLEDDLAHGPAAEQNDPLAVAEPRFAYGVHGHHQRLDQASSPQAHLLRQAEDLLLADIQIFRHQIGIADAGVRTVFRSVAAAGVTQAAGLIRVDRHAVARVERTDILAHRCHDAGALVTEIAVQRIRRGSATASSYHSHQIDANAILTCTSPGPGVGGMGSSLKYSFRFGCIRSDRIIILPPSAWLRGTPAASCPFVF